MKRYMEYMQKHRKSETVSENKPENAGNDKVAQTQAQVQAQTQAEQPSAGDILKSYQRQLKEKSIEIDKMKRAHDDLLKKNEELVSFQKKAVKEKEDFLIRSEIAKTAKKYNVKESAIEDVIGLIGSRLKVHGETPVYENIKDEDGKPVTETVDVESFMGKWLEGKEYFIQPQTQKPAPIPATPSGQKPMVKKEPGTNRHGRQIFSDDDLFKK